MLHIELCVMKLKQYYMDVKTFHEDHAHTRKFLKLQISYLIIYQKRLGGKKQVKLEEYKTNKTIKNKGRN